MGSLINFLFVRLLQPAIRPVLRLVVGLLAVPFFRFLLRRIMHTRELDDELDKDLEEWFKASLVMMFATKNIEMLLFPQLSNAGGFEPLMLGLRLMMILGVIELMPDHKLFAIVYPGPPKFEYQKEKGLWGTLRDYWKPYLKGSLCRYMSQSTPVFAFLAGIFYGTIGWVCYGLAITQFLIIGLVTSQDKAVELLTEFDKQVKVQRDEMILDFHLEGIAKPTEGEMDKEKKISEGPTIFQASQASKIPPQHDKIA